MARKGGIILLLLGAAMAAYSLKNAAPGANNQPGNQPGADPEPGNDPYNPDPIESPVVITPGGGGSEIVIQPYNYHELVAGIDYIPLSSEWDYTMIPSYQQMLSDMQEEAASVGMSMYSAIMYRVGWPLLMRYVNGAFQPSLFMIGLAQAGLTPLVIWNLKSDAISELGYLLHGQASQRPPGVPAGSSICGPNASYNCNFNWEVPTGNRNYAEVRDFVTGYVYASEALRASVDYMANLDFIFQSQMTLQVASIWRQSFNQVPEGQGNFNFPR